MSDKSRRGSTLSPKPFKNMFVHFFIQFITDIQDLNDKAFVMRTLAAIYKSKKPLYCELCGESKKSVVGYLSHKTQCGKSEEEISSMYVKCELCGNVMLPVSVQMHNKLVHPELLTNSRSKQLGTVKEKEEIETGEKHERKAAKA